MYEALKELQNEIEFTDSLGLTEKPEYVERPNDGKDVEPYEVAAG